MDWLRRFLYGRNGADQLTFAALITSMVLSLIGSFRIMWPFRLLSMALLLYCVFRVMSRNIIKRRAENEKFLQFWDRAKNFFNRKKSQLRDRKMYKFFRCPSCGQKLRLPRGRGKIEITCPKCRRSFIGKT